MLNDTLKGIGAYFRAVSMISEARLWKFFLAPALISIGLLVVIVTLALTVNTHLGAWLVSWWTWEWGNGVVEEVGKWVSSILVLLLGLMLYKHLVMILCGPFMSPLSERLEHHLTGHTPNTPVGMVANVRTSIRGIRLAIRLLVRELLLTIPLLLLGFIPGLNLVSLVLLFLLQAYYAGYGNLDFTLERYYNVKDSIRFVHAHRGVALGNGIPFIVLLLTGFGFLIALPLAASAGTIEVLDKVEADSRASSSRHS
jgi:CysZ protein